MRTCVIGDGGWGTALALPLHENGHRINVWGPFRENIDATIEFHENKAFLPGIEIPHDIDWTAEAAEAVTGAEMVVMAVPTKFYAGVASSFGPHIPKAAQVVSVSKGFDPATLQRMSELASRLFPRSSIAVLSGPSHAEEVARGIPTAVVVASDNARQAGALQEAFGNKRFRVYT
ncbi:MAG: NAD(P)H-dependent glycerol-3-phosphate dehydrogenase, partial [Verrucomicrobiota bacterium]